MDLDALSAQQGFAVRADLPLAPPTQTTMAAVLGVAAEADALAKDMDVEAELSSDSEIMPALEVPEGQSAAAAEAAGGETVSKRGGGYGNMGKGKGQGNGGQNAAARVASSVHVCSNAVARSACT